MPTGRHHRQQRRAVLGVGAEGDALHRVLQPAQRARPSSLQNITGFMVGRDYDAAASRKTAPRWCTPWQRRSCRKFTVVIGVVWCRQLRHVRPRLRSPPAVDVAQRAHLGDGRRTGRRMCHDGEARSAGTAGQACRRMDERDPRADPRQSTRLKVTRPLLHRAPLGRRRDRSGIDTRRRWRSAVGGAQCPGRRAARRRLRM